MAIILIHKGVAMYFDSDTKIVISGVVIVLAGFVVWKKQDFFIALVYCVFFIKVSMVFLGIVALLFWGKPPDLFYFIFPVISVFVAVFFPDKRWPKHTGQIFRCLSCMKFVNYQIDKCPYCGSDMDPKNVWKKQSNK